MVFQQQDPIRTLGLCVLINSPLVYALVIFYVHTAVWPSALFQTEAVSYLYAFPVFLVCGIHAFASCAVGFSGQDFSPFSSAYWLHRIPGEQWFGVLPMVTSQ